MPVASQRILRKLGKWMDLHGDAIYGTQPSPYEYEFDWGRMTTKDDRAFLFVYQWPAEKLVLHGVRNRVKRAYIM